MSSPTATAQLDVVEAGPFVTTQDVGRPGWARYGVPRSGPMDGLSHAAANAAVGNAPGATAVEISRAGATFECRARHMIVGVAGGGFDVEIAGQPVTSWGVFLVSRGDRVVIRAGEWGSWAYLAVAGELVAPRWLDSASRHTPSTNGGAALSAGDRIVVAGARLDESVLGRFEPPDLARPRATIRAVPGPQDQHLVDPTVLFTSDWEVTGAADRMGTRLSGPPLELRAALSIPSEPIVRGAVQVAGDGVPTVLIADHQTVGGYPKAAVVVSVDLDRFAQSRPGDTVRFEAIDPAAAVDVARAHRASAQRYIDGLAERARSAGAGLAGSNLIGGVISATEEQAGSDSGGGTVAARDRSNR